MSGNETPTRGHIQINNVSKIYDPDGAKVLAVDRCTMDIAPGEFCVVVGPSGCGKTTLLNAIAGFHSISSGEILLDGEVLCSADKQAQPGSDRIVVFQNGALFPWFTVLENVTFGPIVQKPWRCLARWASWASRTTTRAKSPRVCAAAWKSPGP